MVNLDTRSREPIYVQIEKEIIKLIRLGVYESNSSLPSVRAMACQLGINPNTVARAYKDLEAQEILYTIGGKGVFVSENKEFKLRNIASQQMKKALIEAKSAGIEKQYMIDTVNSLWEETNDD